MATELGLNQLDDKIYSATKQIKGQKTAQKLIAHIKKL